VLKPVPPHATVAGVPAKVMRTAQEDEPVRRMDQVLSDVVDMSFAENI
jgi:serine acetyltransferase